MEPAMIGTTSIPATVVRDELRIQFNAATKFGEIPTAEAACSSSDTASVARPNLLDLYRNHKPALDAMPKPSRIIRSMVMPTSDHSVNRPLGRRLGTC